MIWLKSNYFGESTKPLCPLCLWQCFIELDSFEQFLHSIFPCCCCLFGCRAKVTSPHMSTKPCFVPPYKPYIFLQTYQPRNLSSSPRPHMMFIRKAYIFLLLRKPYIFLLQIFSSISLSVLFSSTNQRFSFTKYFPFFPPPPKMYIPSHFFLSFSAFLLLHKKILFHIFSSFSISVLLFQLHRPIFSISKHFPPFPSPFFFSSHKNIFSDKCTWCSFLISQSKMITVVRQSSFIVRLPVSKEHVGSPCL